MSKLEDLVMQGWMSYKNKVANGLLVPENEKMMQLHLAQIYQTLAPVFEYEQNESIKVLLEVPVTIGSGVDRIIDIVLSHTLDKNTTCYPVELKCFRLFTRAGQGKRGAQNLGMYDYWVDVENIEGYSELGGYATAFQFTLTDDRYYVETEHRGSQVAMYSTNKNRRGVTGLLQYTIANREGKILLRRTYSTGAWEAIGEFYFISQNVNRA